MSRNPKKYFNFAQLESMAIGAKDERVVASRGIGKSEGFDARVLLRNIFAMPRSCGGLLSPSYTKLLRNTLPAVATALERWGFYRDRHYVIGRKPPRQLNFARPILEPFDFDYVMSWFNGSIIHLISFDGSMSANSMSLDYLMGFEAKFLDYNKIVNEANQANRGRIKAFEDCPWYHGTYYSTDMPTSKMGMWILEDEKKMDVELISSIKTLFAEYSYYVNMPDTQTNRDKIIRYKRLLDSLRSKAFYFGEYNILDNIDLVGKDWIMKQKRDLPALVFQTSILNKRIFKKQNGFYSALDDDVHFYSCANNGALLNLGYNLDEATKDTCLYDGDADIDLPLCIAFDYNAAISSLVIGQVVGRRLNILKSMFVKTPRKLPELVQDFCNYYILRSNRNIVLYYDSTAIHTSAISSESFYEVVQRILIANNFSVHDMYIGNPMAHNEKHTYIDLALKGDPAYLFPQININNNEYLKLALEQAGIKIGRNGFEKDKDVERLDDSADFPDETKTHITDAFDTLFIGCNFYQSSSLSNSVVSW